MEVVQCDRWAVRSPALDRQRFNLDPSPRGGTQPSPACTLFGSNARRWASTSMPGRSTGSPSTAMKAPWGGFDLELQTSTQRLRPPPQAAQPQSQVDHQPPAHEDCPEACERASSHRHVSPGLEV